MDSTLPPAPDVDTKLALGTEDNSASGNVEPKTEPTEMMPLLVPLPHTSSRSPAVDREPRQNSSGRTTPKSERPASPTRGFANNTSNPSPTALAPPADHPNTRKLTVTDALMYLDVVKAQFADSPEVYNMFLDIMEQFKTQQLGTLDVIHRVATLFRNSPVLIEAFHAFLPAGYHIQCDLQTNTAIVTTPTGTQTTVLHAEVVNYPQPPLVPMPDIPPALAPVQPTVPPTAQHCPPTRGNRLRDSPYGHAGLSGVQLRDGDVESHSSGITVPMAFTIRFKELYRDPRVYSTFLAILQEYQQKKANGVPVSPAETYGEVKELLAETPDLLEKFRQFMPELLAGDVRKMFCF
ncbi:hypothetical protein EXIGLDRAFT_724332 [Exidia glandulosa HHB12029]|uniref:PAH2 domain-containing protein n=1 Tax=Exidia glandulosa HHB12029 TaxID=1314781 RepID=A0A165ZYN5_EXIGL|nr:hypothetical protein EXIGLDRAFT_724332 [Exidia glandulosa HHB12029]